MANQAAYTVTVASPKTAYIECRMVVTVYLALFPGISVSYNVDLPGQEIRERLQNCFNSFAIQAVTFSAITAALGEIASGT